MVLKMVDCGAIVLAGGNSTRMGRPKALLHLDGMSLIERIIFQLRPITQDIWIITNQPERYAFLNLPTHADFIPGAGPLAGIFTGLAVTSSEPVLVTACDTPFVTKDYFLFLLNHWSEKIDCVVPKINGRYEPLEAVYSHRTMPVIEDLLKKGERRVTSLLKRIRIKELDEQELKQMGNLEKLFWNVNDPNSFEEARKRV